MKARAGLSLAMTERFCGAGRSRFCREISRALPTDDYGDNIVMPGFIDAHIHFPQLRMLAAPGKDLLDWLTRFTFPEEARYSDFDYAKANAKTFLQNLFANGTTAAMAFCSVHKACADALFGEAQSRGMALVTGKTMMDRNALPAVHDDADDGRARIPRRFIRPGMARGACAMRSPRALRLPQPRRS